MLWRLIPSKAAVWGLFAAIGAILAVWLRIDAKADQKRNTIIEDYENAEDIQERVSNSRADPDRLRRYEDSGYRD